MVINPVILILVNGEEEPVAEMNQVSSTFLKEGMNLHEIPATSLRPRFVPASSDCVLLTVMYPLKHSVTVKPAVITISQRTPKTTVLRLGLEVDGVVAVNMTATAKPAECMFFLK